MKYWALVMTNYCDEDEIIYFENFSIAKENFEKLCEIHCNDKEFDRSTDECEWFDPNYNEYNTYVKLDEVELEIYNRIVF